MELPPSRSSSTSDCKSLCLPPLDGPDSPPTPDSVDAGSEASWRPTSSSPCSLTEAPGISMGLGLGLGLGLGPGMVVGSTSWRERETEDSLRRLLPTLDALLQQLDRVTMATEDLYHIECKLEQAQRKSRYRGRERGGGGGQGGRCETGQRGKEEDKVSAGWTERKSSKEKQKMNKRGKKTNKSELSKDCGNIVANPRKTRVATSVPFLKPRPVSASAHTPAPQSSASPSGSTPPPTPVTDKSATDSCSLPISSANTPNTHGPAPKTPSAPPCTPVTTPSSPSTSAPTPLPRDWDPPTERETLSSSSLFNHPAHTTTIPTRKRKRKPPPLKNKVHPNLDRHGPGHPKSWGLWMEGQIEVKGLGWECERKRWVKDERRTRAAGFVPRYPSLNPEESQVIKRHTERQVVGGNERCTDKR